jgi:AcrR family transcriptional regulator
MPKLKPATQAARREHILDAAERCFAKAGFHRTTMQDICKAADVSAGALYVYFASKEALIAGIVERDRSAFAVRFAKLADAPDFLEALEAIAQHYFIEEPDYKRLMRLEIGIEATRNAKIGEIFHSVDSFCRQSFTQLFQRLAAEGRIEPELDIATLANVFMVLGDGLFWRRGIDPAFDIERVLPAVIGTVARLLDPAAPRAAYAPRSVKK